MSYFYARAARARRKLKQIVSVSIQCIMRLINLSSVSQQCLLTVPQQCLNHDLELLHLALRAHDAHHHARGQGLTLSSTFRMNVSVFLGLCVLAYIEYRGFTVGCNGIHGIQGV